VSTWAPIVGALAAALIAWLAIAAVAWLGHGNLDLQPVRWLGALALGLLAVDLAGLAVPWPVPPALLGIGFVAGLVREPDEEQGS